MVAVTQMRKEVAEGLTPTERRALVTLRATVEELMAVDPLMPLSRVLVLLTLIEEDGLTNEEIALRAQLDTPKVSRDVSAMGPANRYGSAGYGWLDTDVDPQDRRQLLRRWNAYGRAFVRRFVETLTRGR